jgi:hypothetical protein
MPTFKNQNYCQIKLDQTFCSVERSGRSAYFGTPVNSSSSLAVCEIDLYQQLQLLSFLKIFSSSNSCSNFEIRHPRCVCKQDIVGKCSQTQLYQWRCLITIIRKTTCFGTGTLSGFLLKYLELNTIHIMCVCTCIDEEISTSSLLGGNFSGINTADYSPQLCSRLILPHRPTWIFSF